MSQPQHTGIAAQNHTSHGNPSASAAPSLFPGRQWQQVLARDTAADGQFFYAVKSTMIYCRPSCPSRRPARQNVRFFPTASAAEQAGFRACKRCRPELATPRPDPQAGPHRPRRGLPRPPRHRTHPPRRPGPRHRRRPPHPPARLPPRPRRQPRRVRPRPARRPLQGRPAPRRIFN